jgi:predicted Zn-dependent protease
MDMQTYFNELADHLTSRLKGSEVYTCSFGGEDSDFVRFNNGAVRQAGNVTQREIFVDLIDGGRHAGGGITLSGDAPEDHARLDALLGRLREKLPHLREDPYLLYATENHSSERHGENTLPSAEDALASIRNTAAGLDLVGLYAAGEIGSGFANSLGQRNWFDSWSYNLDWSFYHTADKAVKSAYAGFAWDQDVFETKVRGAAHQLEAVKRKPMTVKPGRYRVFLAPAAVHDFVGMLGYGGFGLKAQKTKATPLLKMLSGEARLSPAITILENTAEGVAPNFQGSGFIRPDHVTLVREGTLADNLVSPRSAREYGVETNGASAGESPESLDLAGGALATERALSDLDTGIYIGNVHYLNYSDRSACRTTGMTRFATFWVEKGEIQAPLNVMRFDETAYRVLGENLVGLTAERDLILDPGTYAGRHTNSGRVPGALVEDFAFTL